MTGNAFTLETIKAAQQLLIQANAPTNSEGHFIAFLHPLQAAMVRMLFLHEDLTRLLKQGRSASSYMRGVLRRAAKMASRYPYKTAEEINDLHDRLVKLTATARPPS